jgi:hypothetical protein
MVQRGHCHHLPLERTCFLLFTLVDGEGYFLYQNPSNYKKMLNAHFRVMRGGVLMQTQQIFHHSSFTLSILRVGIVCFFSIFTPLAAEAITRCLRQDRPDPAFVSRTPRPPVGQLVDVDRLGRLLSDPVLIPSREFELEIARQGDLPMSLFGGDSSVKAGKGDVGTAVCLASTQYVECNSVNASIFSLQ